MNLSLMQRRQRLSAIKEIKEMMSRLDTEPDGNASRRSPQLAEDGGQDSDISDSNEHDEGRADAARTTTVAHSQLWKFAVHRRAAHAGLRGSTATVQGLRQAVFLDLRTCGSRHSEWRKMLPPLEHVMQHCRLYLVVEYEWSSVPGPALEVCKGGEIIMTPQQQEFFDKRFMTLADRVEHARIFTRMELSCKDGQDKVSRVRGGHRTTHAY